MPQANLHLIETQQVTPAEEMLGLIIPALEDAEKVLASLRALMTLETRALAKERGVGLVREEHVRQEFRR
jgi:hypothetical protein